MCVTPQCFLASFSGSRVSTSTTTSSWQKGASQSQQSTPPACGKITTPTEAIPTTKWRWWNQSGRLLACKSGRGGSIFLFASKAWMCACVCVVAGWCVVELWCLLFWWLPTVSCSGLTFCIMLLVSYSLLTFSVKSIFWYCPALFLFLW